MPYLTPRPRFLRFLSLSALTLALVSALSAPAGAYSIHAGPNATIDPSFPILISGDGSTMGWNGAGGWASGPTTSTTGTARAGLLLQLSRDGSLALVRDSQTYVLYDASGSHTIALPANSGIRGMTAAAEVLIGETSPNAFVWQLREGGAWSNGADITTFTLDDSTALGAGVFDISDDGSTVTGTVKIDDFNTQLCAWVRSGSQYRLLLPSETDDIFNTHPEKLSANGKVALLNAPAPVYGPVRHWNLETNTVVCSPDPQELTGLGGPFEYGLRSTALNADGSVIVGFGLGAECVDRAFISTPSGGLRVLADDLAAKGVDMTGWELQYATGISDDGTIITGGGKFNNQWATFVVNYADGFAVRPAALDSARPGEPCTRALSASGGWPKYTFDTSVAAGALPPGLALGNDGVISGTPTRKGAYAFKVRVTDAEGTVFTSQTLSMTIGDGTATTPRALPGVTLLLLQ